MLRVLSVLETKAAERMAVENGFSEDILIESAASAAFQVAAELLEKNKAAVVFTGGGKNGADGLSLARMLFLRGTKVSVVSVTKKLCVEAESRMNALRFLGAEILPLQEIDLKYLKTFGLIVDALCGTGLTRPLEGETAQAAQLINGAGVKVMSLDIPSGLNADSGAFSVSVKADVTVAFGAIKTGMLQKDAYALCGDVHVADIGIRGGIGAILCDEENPSPLKRLKVTNKGDYGRVKIIGGSANMVGAPFIAAGAAEAALRGGAGLVTLCVPASIIEAYRSRVTEATLFALPDQGGNAVFDEEVFKTLCADASAIVLGPGMGESAEIIKMIRYFFGAFSGALVCDADALNALAKDPAILEEKRVCNLILTPHTREFERLTSGYRKTFGNAVDETKYFAEKFACTIINKSFVSVIANERGNAYVNMSGTPAMAKGGSGDALAGMIGALACRYQPIEAAARGAYLLGKAATLAEKDLSTDSLLVSDYIKYLK